VRRRTLHVAAGLLALSAGAACLGPYAILGQALDQTISLGDQPTWIQATPEQTTLIVFAAADGGFSAPFTLTTIARDQSTVILAGSYHFDGNQVILNSTLRYVLRNQYNLPVTQRDGAQRFDIDAGSTYLYSRDGGILTLDGSPSLGSFAYFPDALVGLKATSQTEAECVMRVFELTILSSETRILGFNGPAIIQYTSPASFNGTLAGSVNINVESLLKPNTTLDYQSFIDFSGFRVDGIQYTITDLDGNGNTTNTVYFRMTIDPADGSGPQTLIAGQVGYDLGLVSGTPSSGTYTLTVDAGQSFPMSYDVINTMDVTPCVSTPH
jgi:hypothetical protein